MIRNPSIRLVGLQVLKIEVAEDAPRQHRLTAELQRKGGKNLAQLIPPAVATDQHVTPDTTTLDQSRIARQEDASGLLVDPEQIPVVDVPVIPRVEAQDPKPSGQTSEHGVDHESWRLRLAHEKGPLPFRAL